MTKFKTYKIEAIAVEHDVPFAQVPCGTCHECCIRLSPFLTPAEFESGQYVYTFISLPDGSPGIAIPRDDEGCFYFKNGACSIYDKRPKACRQFDCREGHYPPFDSLVKAKFGGIN